MPKITQTNLGRRMETAWNRHCGTILQTSLTITVLQQTSSTVQVHGIQPVRLVDLGTTGQVSPRQAPVLCGGQDKKRIPIDHIHGLPLCLIEPGPVGQHRCFLVWPLCNAAQRWSTRTWPVRSHSLLVGPGSLGQLQAGIEEPLDVV
ncbi:uncharacterized protein LOC121837974 [Ixodes scapularis]|uniref:uncharacterized protein LOC121837974 n=1 Tax=Ixodes scapularis TaxID=6945 RepID=UPI001C3898B5|nr:uncharacterized protein LOC121837974 [Ixodes scapularis]